MGYDSPKDICNMTPPTRKELDKELESVVPTMHLIMSSRMVDGVDGTTDDWDVDDGIVVVGTDRMHVTDSARNTRVRTFTFDKL